MARTDVHRPERVQQRDPYLRRWFTDIHRHHWGACDLDEFLASPQWIRIRCYREVSAQAPNLCGCRLCTFQAYRRLGRRQERVAWRSIRRRLLAEHRGGGRDLDVPPIRGKAW
ncbi:hypothetical protein J5U46_20700 [Micromonospora tulbaghiae]|uniref:Uncharacterized protein n=1 Tax=Micromonospora tulbaghiae TaxID=479978 RepID=A0AAW4JMZ6_9ACTN|nr:hypothetical protein [Micromonospora tulbaghiae]MBO4142570.1 hypothetical protein [Micromonospora tulbaghiae]